jgi:DNA-binding transcriptional LysR family regulator
MGGWAADLAVPSRVVTNNAESYIACCRAGLGLIQIPL